MNRPRRDVIVPSVWAPFFEETHIPGAVRVGDTLHVTGHTGDTADGSFSDSPEAQIRQTFANVALTLAEAGATWSDVVSLTTYHVGLRGQTAMLLEVAADYLDAPYPAWTAVGVTELWSPEAVVEISCIAVLPRATAEEEAAVDCALALDETNRVEPRGSGDPTRRRVPAPRAGRGRCRRGP